MAELLAEGEEPDAMALRTVLVALDRDIVALTKLLRGEWRISAAEDN